MHASVFQPTFLKGRTGGERRPLSDGGVPLATTARFSLAAGQKDVSAVEAQVPVRFAAVALAAQLQPQEAAVTALLKVRRPVLTWIFDQAPLRLSQSEGWRCRVAELTLECVCAKRFGLHV